MTAKDVAKALAKRFLENGQYAEARDLQTTGTFPELTKRTPKKGGKKRC